MVHIQDWLNQHGATLDDEGRMTVYCQCDGTLIFLVEMVKVFCQFGFREIKYDGNVVTEGIPKEKPWCNYLYEVSGLLPEHWKWMKDGNNLIIETGIPPEGARRFEPSAKAFLPAQAEMGTQYIDTGVTNL